MLKKFYIVQNQKDLLSGQIIPRKVLDFMPVSTFYPTIQPMPIQKFTGLTIPVGSQTMSPMTPMGSYGVISPLSPFSPINPYSNISVSRTPLIPSYGCGSTIGCGSSNVYGPPIIKLSPFVNNGANATVQIISDSNIFTIVVPYRYIRNVVNDIYLNSTNVDRTKPQVTFRILTPTIDSSLVTTFEKMIDIVKNINIKYSNVLYRYDNGQTAPLATLLNLLISLYEKKLGRSYSDINLNI